VCAVGVGLPLIWDLPGHWRLLGALQNAGHTVLFFAMAYCLVWRGTGIYTVVLALTGVGISIEIIQYFIGKDCDIHDVMLDALGIFSGTTFFFGVKKKSLLLSVAAVLLLAIAFYIPSLVALCYLTQWRNYPVIASFDEPGRVQLIDYHDIRYQRHLQIGSITAARHSIWCARRKTGRGLL
jgi:VanZ like family